MPISVSKGDRVSGGAPFDDVVVKFSNATYKMFAYEDKQGNKLGDPICVFSVRLTNEETGESRDEIFSCGSNLAPCDKDDNISDEGVYLTLKPGASGRLRESTKFAKFLSALEDAGFPGDKISMDCTFINGLVARVMQVQEYDFNKQPIVTTGKDGKEYPKTVTHVVEIVQLPGQRGSVTAENDLRTMIVDVLKTAPKKTLVWNKVIDELIGDLKKHPQGTYLSELAYDVEWLSNPENPWEWNSKTVFLFLSE